MVPGALGQTLVLAVSTAIKFDNASAPPVIEAGTAQRRTSMEWNCNKSSAVTASVLVSYM